MADDTNCYARLDIEQVQSLDPLGADDACAALPRMNEAKDVAALAATLRRMAPSLERLRGFSFPECLAAMRDIGMFLGSIKRHGTEPLEVFPEIEPVLLELGRRTDMVPRDTVHHYVIWNPEGVRERTYSGDPMERKLMSSVRLSLPRLGEGVDVAGNLAGRSLEDPEFAPMAARLADCVAVMEPAMDIVLRHVSPVFFARELRPYFEDIRVNGRRYLGPAAAHVPISLIDLVLWASDHVHPGYEEFWRESAEFSLPAWRELYEVVHTQPSIVTRLKNMLVAVSGDVSGVVRASAEAVALVLRALVVFRGKHLRMARQAYAEEIRLYELGSGGASVALLTNVLALTRENGALLCRSFAPKKQNCEAEILEV